MILVIIPTFWEKKQSHRIHNFLVEHDEKHNCAIDTKTSFMDCMNVFIYSGIFKLGMLMN